MSRITSALIGGYVSFRPGDALLLSQGPLAHLVERFHGMEEVAGSIPARSTSSNRRLYPCQRSAQREAWHTSTYSCRPNIWQYRS